MKRKLITIVALLVILLAITGSQANAKTRKTLGTIKTVKGKAAVDCVTDKQLAKRWCTKHYPKCKVKFVKEGDQRINIRKGKRIVYVEVVKSRSRGNRHGTTKLGYVIGYNVNVHKGKSVTSYVIWNPYTDYCDDVVAVVDNGRIR